MQIFLFQNFTLRFVAWIELLIEISCWWKDHRYWMCVSPGICLFFLFCSYAFKYLWANLYITYKLVIALISLYSEAWDFVSCGINNYMCYDGYRFWITTRMLGMIIEKALRFSNHYRLTASGENENLYRIWANLCFT